MLWKRLTAGSLSRSRMPNADYGVPERRGERQEPVGVLMSRGLPNLLKVSQAHPLSKPAQALQQPFLESGDGTMARTKYSGTVRNSSAEEERDKRILALAEQGLAPSVIAQRMGITTHSARYRAKRAKAARDTTDASATSEDPAHASSGFTSR